MVGDYWNGGRAPRTLTTVPTYVGGSPLFKFLVLGVVAGIGAVWLGTVLGRVAFHG
jgi:hypothetical protein